VNDIEDWLVRYVRQAAERRADPGIAILSRHSDMPHVLAFGRRSQNEVMKLDDASTFSAESNVRLRALGGRRLGSIGALASGIVIVLTGWTPIDAIASLAICLLIVLSSLRLLREGVHALMEGVPLRLSVEAIGMEMARHEAVDSVHDLHVWTLSGSRIALSAHVIVRDLSRWERTLNELQDLLRERFGIEHVTLQPEPPGAPAVRVPVPDPRRRKG
jgi:cobalt-zinc-cadmium efflux system protein